jgi:ribosomal protein L33
MIRLLTLFLLTLITFSLQAQKAKAKAQTEIVIKEVQVITKASADSLLEKQNEYLKTSVDQLDKAYSFGYTVINSIVGVFGAIIAVLATWGVIVVIRFKREKDGMIQKFKEERESMFSDFSNSSESIIEDFQDKSSRLTMETGIIKDELTKLLETATTKNNKDFQKEGNELLEKVDSLKESIQKEALDSLTHSKYLRDEFYCTKCNSRKYVAYKIASDRRLLTLMKECHVCKKVTQWKAINNSKEERESRLGEKIRASLRRSKGE